MCEGQQRNGGRRRPHPHGTGSNGPANVPNRNVALRNGSSSDAAAFSDGTVVANGRSPDQRSAATKESLVDLRSSAADSSAADGEAAWSVGVRVPATVAFATESAAVVAASLRSVHTVGVDARGRGRGRRETKSRGRGRCWRSGGSRRGGSGGYAGSRQGYRAS